MLSETSLKANLQRKQFTLMPTELSKADNHNHTKQIKSRFKVNHQQYKRKLMLIEKVILKPAKDLPQLKVREIAKLLRLLMWKLKKLKMELFLINLLMWLRLLRTKMDRLKLPRKIFQSKGTLININKSNQKSEKQSQMNPNPNQMLS